MQHDKYSYSECYDAMASSDNVLTPHSLEWIYNEGFDNVMILDKVLEAILSGATLLESMSESDSMCKNNGGVITM